MAAIDKVKKARGLASPDPSLPTETLREQIVELIAELRGFRGQIGAWPQAIIERLAALFRTAQQQNEERGQREVGAWRQERAAVAQQTAETLRSFQGSVGTLHTLVTRLEKQQEGRILGMSRDMFKGLWFGVLFTGIATTWGGVIWLQVGPASQVGAALREAETTLSTYRQLWDTATAAEQKKIQKRLADKTAGQ